MARSKKVLSKTKNKKGSNPKSMGKGAKVFIGFLAFFVIVLVLLMVVNVLNNAMTAAKYVKARVDLEVGGTGDGPGQFKEPWAVAVDGQGNFYVTDFAGRRVEKFDPMGQPVLSIGAPGKEDGQFDQPSGLYVDPQGEIYVCDTFNHRIQKFDTDGNVLKVWNHNFFGPRSIAGDGLGRIYVSDTGNHKIQVFDADGNYLSEWGGFGTADGKFREPVGVTVDPQGFVYVADSDNRRIQKFDSRGKFIAAIKVSLWRGKNDEVPYLAFANGYLYASNASAKTVLKFDPSGNLLAIVQKGDKEGFGMAAGIAVDAQDRVYVVEKGMNRVARFLIPAMPQPSR